MPRSRSIAWEVIAETDFEKIRAAHSEWTEEECRAEQMRAALAALLPKPKKK